MTASCKHDLATLIFLMRKKLQIFENQKSLNRQKVSFSDLMADQFNLTLFSKNVLHTAVSLVYCKNMYTPQFHFSAAKCRMKLTENDLSIVKPK